MIVSKGCWGQGLRHPWPSMPFCTAAFLDQVHFHLEASLFGALAKSSLCLNLLNLLNLGCGLWGQLTEDTFLHTDLENNTISLLILLPFSPLSTPALFFGGFFSNEMSKSTSQPDASFQGKNGTAGFSSLASCFYYHSK